LLEGESGVGKELIARAIHGSSERRSKPFVAVNCGAIPDNLVESTLFGHERGAFTGATERHVGKFVEASGGTLLLDEVSELPLAAQVKLLRAIQGDEIDTVGGRKPIKVDVRLISACNRNLLTAVRDGRFREDLFYRLNVLPIAVPPLRERAEDIPELVRHFVARCTAEEGKRIRTVTAPAMALLAAYSWPGNVRQLENAIFRAVVLAETDEIGVNEFPQIASQMAAAPTAAPPTAPEAIAPVADETASLSSETATHALVMAPDLVAPAPVTVPVLDPAGEIRPLDAIEADLIRFAIEHYGGQMSQVARRLRIGRSTLYRRLKDLGLESAAPSGVSTERHSRGIV
jgi:DNA-binding NtrC family response regulator